MSKLLKILKVSILAAVIIYCLACALIYFYPKMFFYNPSSEPSNIENAHANGYKTKQVEYKSADGTELFAWYTKPTTKKKVVVFMHGNSYNIETFYYKLMPFVEEGYGALLPEYRGFGGVKGKISEENLANDAIAAVRYLNSMGYKNKDIIVYGMSLGTYMATNTVVTLNKNGNFDALVLEVPFDSLLNTTKAVVPVPLPFDYIVKDKYESNKLIDKINTRLFIMGGSKDPTIPVYLAEKLFEQAKEPKTLKIYQGGAHSNLFNFRNDKDILSWLEGKK